MRRRWNNRRHYTTLNWKDWNNCISRNRLVLYDTHVIISSKEFCLPDINLIT